MPWGLLIDVYGNDVVIELSRVLKEFGEGWIHYSFLNPATGRNEPKASYIKGIDWDGNPAELHIRFPDFFYFLEVLAISPDPGGRALVTKVPPSLVKQSALQELLQ